MAASPLLSWRPEKGQQCYINPAFLGIPKQRETKSEVHVSRLPSWGPTKRAKMLHHPCILGAGETKGVKIRIRCLTPAFAWQKGGECYVTPEFSRIPKQTQTKSEVHVSHLPSRGPRRAPKCYGILAFSEIPKQPGTTTLEVDASPVHSRRPKRGRKCYVHFVGLLGHQPLLLVSSADVRVCQQALGQPQGRAQGLHHHHRALWRREGQGGRLLQPGVLLRGD